jgi:protein phosphatase
MKIRIYPPCALNEIGGRSNQEDSIYPPKGMATDENRFFLVCDGMGGHENGEIASKSICDSFGDFLNGVNEEDFNQHTFERALEYAYSELNAKDDPSISKKMGSTLTFLSLYSKGALMAHIGDSRIYHLRRTTDNTATILYKSRDHSLVNDLLQAEIITPEEAATHPKRNVITNVMQPNQKNPGKPTIYETVDVQKNDFFFLCSDGVLEQLSDNKLIDVILAPGGTEEKIQAIYNICQGNTQDNFSAYLIRVAEVTIDEQSKETVSAPSSSDELSTSSTVEGATNVLRNASDDDNLSAEKHRSLSWIWILIALILFVIGSIYFYGSIGNCVK